MLDVLFKKTTKHIEKTNNNPASTREFQGVFVHVCIGLASSEAKNEYLFSMPQTFTQFGNIQSPDPQKLDLVRMEVKTKPRVLRPSV